MTAVTEDRGSEALRRGSILQAVAYADAMALSRRFLEAGAMDQMIWVEVLSRRREVAARLRFVGPEVRIGRAYDNDVVLDDPFVAASHVRVFRDSTGALVAEDAGSVNGIFLDRDNSRQARIVIDGERPIRIGHTPGSHSRSSPRRAARAHGRPAMPMLLIRRGGRARRGGARHRSAVGVACRHRGPKASNYPARPITIGGAIVAWVGGWVLAAPAVWPGRPRA